MEGRVVPKSVQAEAQQHKKDVAYKYFKAVSQACTIKRQTRINAGLIALMSTLIMFDEKQDAQHVHFCL